MPFLSGPRKRRKRPVARSGRIAADPSPERGKIVCLFGPPQSGVSSVAEALTSSSNESIALVNPDWGDLEEQVRRVSQSADIVLIDGFPPCAKVDVGNQELAGPDAVQYLYDRRLVFPGAGALVRIRAPAPYGESAGKGWDHWHAGLPALEMRIQLLGLPYLTVPNEPGEHGLMTAVLDLARRAHIEETD